VIEVDPGARGQGNAACVGVSDHFRQLGIEEDLAPIRELDGGDPWVIVNRLLEVAEAQEPNAEAFPGFTGGCRTRRAFELAGRRSVYPDLARSHDSAVAAFHR
jgi:hypothetical protein